MVTAQLESSAQVESCQRVHTWVRYLPLCSSVTMPTTYDGQLCHAW